MERKKVREVRDGAVLEYVQKHHQVQATGLAKAMVISKSRAVKALDELERAGLIEKVDKKFFRARSENVIEA